MERFAAPRHPNILIIMTDEERYPPVYETPEIRAWRQKHLPAHEFLRRRGLSFTRHYAASTACAPSRATVFTGQYPSLHGVSQTNGAAKAAYDPEMFWLDPNTVPTLGDYFRTAGYRTFYRGKWHLSEADILIPGTKTALPSYDTNTGVPDPALERYYHNADRLAAYGFSGWIGPEPHGSNPRNSGSSARFGVSGRDIVYGDQVVSLLSELAAADDRSPWLLVASFVNPHDIALFGVLSRLYPSFQFAVDPAVPPVPPPPTFHEPLDTKPRCQRSYRRTYGEAFQPLVETEYYRRLYYQLQSNVDRQMLRVLVTLAASPFYEDTIVIFFSDHGELLGAHGGLTQKWYCTYEEAIHVPLVIHNPRLCPIPRTVDMPTSHIDLLPTLLGLAGVDVAAVQAALRSDHTEVHPLPGRDLSPLLRGGAADRAWEPLYFMTDDDVTHGLGQQNFLGWNYNSVLQPNHVESVIATLPGPSGRAIWKYSRYFDNPQFWTNPGQQDDVQHEFGPPGFTWNHIQASICQTTQKNRPVPDEYEMYNLTDDPLEMMNLADPRFATPASRAAATTLVSLLRSQCRTKRLYPSNGVVPGAPSCRF
ncbi:MAG: sulfatase-like hydrolase/transferase [bacterium]|jgi:arylsulfatase A-like enzyme